MANVLIDANSGFCGGVIRAIETAQDSLKEGPLYSLGDIVHNEEELSRLGGLGLRTIGKQEMGSLPRGARLLIRAHGEPPQLYSAAEALGLKVIDCTCPVVLALQKSIREAYSRLCAMSPKGRLVIFGKVGHPEVLGLVGQVGGDAVVIESEAGLDALITSGELDASRPMEVFSQTTMSPDAYGRICDRLATLGGKTVCHNTICRQVASRHTLLQEFASGHDAVVFVSGRNSSNGKVLFDLCRQANPRSFFISSPDELSDGMFAGCASIGVCGATSTPKWLLEKTAAAIKI